MNEEYKEFLRRKSQSVNYHGFKPLFIPNFLFDFQKDLVEWAVKKGKAAIFADTGLGKTPMQLVWGQNIIEKTNKSVLLLTPLAVSQQTARESEKFNIEYSRCKDGKVKNNEKRIIITNYERLHKFNPDDFSGVICDESSIIKNFEGKTKKIITEFMRTKKYRLLCTATASPNDYIELGTSAEALGEMGYMDMLQTFFKTDDNSLHPGARKYNVLWWGVKWRFKAHSETPFWRWVVSWARAIRKPEDLGYSNKDFELPPLIEKEHLIKRKKPKIGELLVIPAKTLQEQRDERRDTLKDRCELVSSLVKHKNPVVVWCHLNSEGDLLEKIIFDSKQVSGRDSDEEKEEKLISFSNRELRVLITKPKIGAFGLNWQHCNHMTFFPSHSFEQYYQGVRRCWRFGQKKTVYVDIITSIGESGVMKNLQRKSEAADRMFTNLVKEMNNELKIDRSENFKNKVETPKWL